MNTSYASANIEVYVHLGQGVVNYTGLDRSLWSTRKHNLHNLLALVYPGLHLHSFLAVSHMLLNSNCLLSFYEILFDEKNKTE